MSKLPIERLSGRVLSVTEDLAGDTLAADATGGDTVLFLNDVTYFLPDGGEATLYDDTNAETIVYTEVDYDLDTITLESGISNSYLAESTVDLYPAVPMRFAEIQPTGANDDTLRAAVPTQVALVLPIGTRADTEREQVLIEYDTEASQFVVRDVYSNAEAEAFIQDQFESNLIDCGGSAIEVFDDLTDLGEFGTIIAGAGLTATDNGDDTVTIDVDSVGTSFGDLDDVQDDIDDVEDLIIAIWDADSSMWIGIPPTLDGGTGEGGLLFISGIDGEDLIIDGGGP